MRSECALFFLFFFFSLCDFFCVVVSSFFFLSSSVSSFFFALLLVISLSLVWRGCVFVYVSDRESPPAKHSFSLFFLSSDLNVVVHVWGTWPLSFALHRCSWRRATFRSRLLVNTFNVRCRRFLPLFRFRFLKPSQNNTKLGRI